MGYFKVDIKPLFPASLQHSAANMTDGKALADWTEFEVPKGAVELIGLNILYKGVDGLDIDPTDFEIIWAKGNADGTAPTSLATPGAVVGTSASNPWFNNLQGRTYVDASNFKDGGHLTSLRMISPSYGFGGRADASTAVNLGVGAVSHVLQGEPNSGSSVGYDKLYCALIAKATHAYTTSTLNVNGAHASGTTGAVLTVATIDALLAFAAGDVIHDEDDQLVGTVKSVDSATKITLEANIANSVADGKHLYNSSPIVVQASFKK